MREAVASIAAGDVVQLVEGIELGAVALHRRLEFRHRRAVRPKPVTPVHESHSRGTAQQLSSPIERGVAPTDDQDTPIAELLTHTFALGDYRKALEVAANKSGGESIKVAFRF